mmetsp:Transcript_7082/g.5336  ORF Transcript_7082/g.5336 Transcript_7082/m.5336 type:complete len:99 (-) Transcript_7082:385-681(-)
MDDTYSSDYQRIMRNSTCNDVTYFTNQTNGTEACTKFLSGILTQGLHATIIMYFEELRSTLIQFSHERSIATSSLDASYKAARYKILNTTEMYNLYVI